MTSDIVKLAAERSEFVTDVDGFVYYWPKSDRGGSYAAHHLRQLADELDRRNADWEKQINDYFDKQEARDE